MAYLGRFAINDYLTFPVNVHSPVSGAATDADAAPTYRIYEDETATPILTGTMALLDDANTVGFYSERIQLTAANGLENQKSYTIYMTCAVSAVVLTGNHTFQLGDDVTRMTLTELAAVPAAAPTVAEALALVYMWLRNKFTVSASQAKIHNNADTAIFTATLSDDGTTFTRTKIS